MSTELKVIRDRLADSISRVDQLIVQYHQAIKERDEEIEQLKERITDLVAKSNYLNRELIKSREESAHFEKSLATATGNFAPCSLPPSPERSS